MREDRMPEDQLGADARGADSNAAKCQGAVLALLWDEHPDQLNEAELIREVAGEHPEFKDRDGCERAIEALIREGLLQRAGTLVLLTRAARSFARLERL